MNRILPFVLPLILPFVLLPGTSAADSPDRLDVSVDVPVIEFTDDLSQVTGGAGWDLAWNMPVSRFGKRELRGGDLTADGSAHFRTDGIWLLDPDLGRRPATADLHWDFGFELAPRPVDDIPGDLFEEDITYTDIGFFNWIYNYRFAITLEAGLEADPAFEKGFLAFGTGLRMINMARSGRSGLLPTFHIYYEGVAGLQDEAVGGVESNRQYRRLRLLQRHQLSLGLIGLPDAALAAGYQYTRDFGQTAAYREDGFDSRFGWVVDLSCAIRWSGRDERLNRIDLFSRYSGGRIAPVTVSDNAFTFGLRIPYSR
ncbi:hypothetical protein [Natronogracilivirga saccharolytica]|uniref:MipA/OmpV family protein n=1 Tax=Natronogracilivirga saccharolytica TaxID=2812953 RepID=A0A8J7RS49_9BACT|nr:hypothetical protein [Natronogracilivirga saccharolytica]MBP3192764.1 hypothetical protein [Natronogracilivirga saccharolytica]